MRSIYELRGVGSYIRTYNRYVAFAVFLLMVTIIGVSSVYAQPGSDTATTQQAIADGKHVLTIYDDGQEKAIITDATTLREAFEKSGVEIGTHDVTEPSLDTELTEAEYTVNIYRARPVQIIDGTKVVKIMTPYHTAKQIVEQAGIAVEAEDKLEIKQNGDFMAGSLEEVIITRATAFSLTFYGKTSTVRTLAKTVGDYLQSKNIILGENDRMSLAASDPITSQTKLHIWREGKQTITLEESVARPVREIKDTSKAIGYKEVQTEGADGVQDVTYEVVVQNGVEISRHKISSVTTKEPAEQVVIVGTDTSAGLTKAKGAMMFTDSNGVVHRETYYDLPMSVLMSNCGAGGVYTIREDGAKIDKNGYVLVAANLTRYPRCSVVETSIGPGKVYDTGGFAAVHPDGFDLATDWTNHDGR